MRDLIVIMIVLGSVPFILARPHIGILVWSWLGYMNPHKLAWGWAQSFPVAEVAGVSTLIGLLFSREKKRFPLNAITLLWLALAVFFTVSSFAAIYPELAWVQWDKVIKIQLVSLLTLIVITSRQRLHQLLWVIVLSLGFYGVKGGLYVLRTGGESGRVWGPPGGFIQDNNSLAIALLMTLPLMFFLRRREGRAWVRAMLLAMIGLTVVAVFGSQSRGALLALLVCGAFLWLKSPGKWPVALAIGIAVATAFFMMPQSWWERMETIGTYEQDSSAQGRLDAWQLAIRLANARAFGGGFECWTEDVYVAYGSGFMKPQAAHSIYFQVVGEHGWIGLMLFLALFMAAWLRARKFIRWSSNDPDLAWERDLVRMLQVSLVAYAIGGAFLSLAYFDLPYHLIGMIVIVDQYVRRNVTIERPEELRGIPGTSSA